jgi:ATP-dependent RNA helicase DDX49/DBP8
VLTTDDLLRRQEEPPRKKSKIYPEFNGLDEIASEVSDSDSDVTLEQERLNDELQRRSAGEEELDDDDSGEPEESLTLGGSDSRFSSTLNGPRIKTKTLPQRLSKSPGVTFASLGISARLQASLAAMSIRTPTEVQAACIPPLLAGQYNVEIILLSLLIRSKAEIV